MEEIGNMNLYVKKDIEYILGIRKYILIATVIFLLSIVLGVIITESTIEGGDIAQHVIMNIPIEEHTQFEMLLIIFKSNLYNCTSAILFGTGLGIIPIYITIYNGVLMGTVISFTSNMPNGIIKFIISIIPHGIIEIPIMFTSVGIGLRMGHNMSSFLRALLKSDNTKLDKKIMFIQELRQGIWICVKWIVPGLLIASIIEAYITPLIIEKIFNRMIS